LAPHVVQSRHRIGLPWILNDTAVHAVTSDFKINLHDQITGADRSYIGPVRDQWLKMVSTGRLVPGIQWPSGKRGTRIFLTEEWGNAHHRRQPRFFKGARTEPSSLIARPMANSCGSSTPDRHRGAAYDVRGNGNQYIAVLAGWGGPMVLNNRPVGKGKVGPGLVLSFALGGSAPLLVRAKNSPGSNADIPCCVDRASD